MGCVKDELTSEPIIRSTNRMKNVALATHVAKAADGGKKPPQIGISEG